MANFELNLKNYSFDLQKIKEESTKCGGNNFIEMINELSKGVLNDIDNLKSIFKKPRDEVIKINHTDITKTNKDLFSESQKLSNPFKTITLPKELVVFIEEVKQKTKEKKEEIGSGKLQQVESTNIYKRRLVSSKFSARSSSITSHTIENTGSLTHSNFSKPKSNRNSIDDGTKSSDNLINSKEIFVKNNNINLNKEMYLEKMEKENLMLMEQNENIQMKFTNFTQKLEEFSQRDKLSCILLDSLMKENKCLEQKFNEKCLEIENIEFKFDEISNNFTFIVEKIKSHQDSLLSETHKLKDLIGYILTCYNEKKFDYLNYIVKFISNNETFIDKAEIAENKKLLINENNQNKKEKYSEYLCSTENKDKDSDNNLFFNNNRCRNRSCSAKDIIFKSDNISINAETDENNIPFKIKVKQNKTNRKIYSYKNIHNLKRNSSIVGERTNMICFSQSQKNFSQADLVKNTVTSLKNLSTNNQTNDQQNGYRSESKESEKSFKIQSKTTNLDKFLLNENTKSKPIRNKILTKKIISKDLDNLMKKKLDELKF